MHKVTKMIELYQLQYFLITVQEGSLLKASEVLHVSQPAITRAIQKMEEELGIPLFDRKKNRLILNRNGKEILEYASNINEIYSHMIEKAKEIKDEHTTLRLSLVAPGPMIRYTFLFTPSDKFRIISAIEKEDDIIRKVNNGSLDLGFVNHPVEIEGITCLKLFDEHLSLYIPKTHFLSGKNGGLYAKEVDGQSFLLSDTLGSWEKWVEEKLPNSRFYRQSRENLADIVTASSIPAFVTDASETLLNLSKDRVAIPFLDEDATMPFFLIYRTFRENKYRELLSKL